PELPSTQAVPAAARVAAVGWAVAALVKSITTSQAAASAARSGSKAGPADAADQFRPGGADLLGQQVTHTSGDAGDADACGHDPSPRPSPSRGEGVVAWASLHGPGPAAI